MNQHTIRVLGLKNCDTCRKARKWLDVHGIAYDFIDYREHPPSAAELRDWAGQLGGWEKLVNRASTTWRQLADAEKQAGTDDEWVALLQRHPALVKRPVLLTPDGSVSTGFKEADWARRLCG